MSAIEPARHARMLAVCDMIIADSETDAHSLDGAPFTGKEIATRLGEAYATHAALARLIREILEPTE